jgi:hypothetical protein
MEANKPKSRETAKKMPLSFKSKSLTEDKIKAHWEKIFRAITEEDKRHKKE